MPFRHAHRVLAGVTTHLETPTLAWLAARMPRAVTSDHLTALALAAMLLAGAGYALAGSAPWALWIVNLGLALNWFGDSLDGTLARWRREERPRYGFYVDHVSDAVGLAGLAGGMMIGGFLSPAIGLAFVTAYFLLSIEAYLAAYCVGVFRLSFAGMGPTELRLALAAANVAVFVLQPARVSTVLGTAVRVFDIGALVAIGGLLSLFAYAAVVNTKALHQKAE